MVATPAWELQWTETETLASGAKVAYATDGDGDGGWTYKRETDASGYGRVLRTASPRGTESEWEPAPVVSDGAFWYPGRFTRLDLVDYERLTDERGEVQIRRHGGLWYVLRGTVSEFAPIILATDWAGCETSQTVGARCECGCGDGEHAQHAECLQDATCRIDGVALCEPCSHYAVAPAGHAREGETICARQTTFFFGPMRWWRGMRDAWKRCPWCTSPIDWYGDRGTCDCLRWHETPEGMRLACESVTVAGVVYSAPSIAELQRKVARLAKHPEKRFSVERAFRAMTDRLEWLSAEKERLMARRDELIKSGPHFRCAMCDELCEGEPGPSGLCSDCAETMNEHFGGCHR